MLKAERHDEIAREVMRRGMASVADLAAYLSVSEITIRRDLDDLCTMGRLQRVRGGARYVRPQDPEPPAVQRQLARAEEKRAIGLAALELIKDGDIVAITSGSTALELARAVTTRPWRNLQVVANSFSVVNALVHMSGVNLSVSCD